MNAQLLTLYSYRFGPYQLTGRRLNKYAVKALSAIAGAVRAGRIAESVFLDSAKSMGHKVSKHG